MNIKDITADMVPEPTDMLEQIFMRQMELEEKYMPIERNNGEHVPELPLDIDTFEGQRRARAMIYRITEELYEAGNCLRNKAWKQTHVKTDKDHFYEELADSFHFVVQLFIELGFSARDVYQLYFRKSEVNKFRQRSKY